MEEALLCRSRDGTPEFTLLAAFQRHRPGWTSLRFDETRERTREAFARLTADFKEAVTPSLLRVDDQTPPLAGWWTGRYPTPDGDELEIVLAPDRYGGGEWLICGPNPEQVAALMRAVVDEIARSISRCLRFSQGGWQDAPELAEDLKTLTWDEVVLPAAQVADIRQTVDAFFAQKEVFHQAGFPWRRGILLIGPPGTGKTMVCKAVAATHADVPLLYVRDIAERSRGDDIEAIFQHARRCAPCILAIEDMDGLIHDQNRTRLLNEMDGFRNNDGLLIIATSNHPHKIDEALLRRPSRFDRVYHIGLPDRPERLAYGLRLLERTAAVPAGTDRQRLAEAVADASEGFTPAFLKEAYLSALLKVAQDGRIDDPAAFCDAAIGQVESLRHYLKKAKNPDRFAEFAPSANGFESIGFRG